MPPPGELASRAKEEMGSKAQELGGEAQTRLREQLDTRSTQAGDQLISVGDALRRSSEQLRGEGKDAPASLVEGASRRAEDVGRYLSTADANQILDDAEGIARRNPWLTALAGAAAGFAASRFLKASSGRRYDRRPYAETGTRSM
jgi:hypothetical protein